MAIIKIKRGQSTNVNNLTLQTGELAVTLDTKELYVGDENGSPSKIGGRYATKQEIKDLFAPPSEEGDFILTYRFTGETQDRIKGVKILSSETPESSLRNAVLEINSMGTPYSLAVSSTEPKLTVLSNVFKNLTFVEKITLDNLNTSKVTTMSQPFAGCTRLKEVQMNNMNFSLLGSLSTIFVNISALTTVSFKSSTTPLVTSLNNMFDNCTNLNQLTIELPDLPQLKSAVDMIRDCDALTTLDLSKVDVSKATSLLRMVIFVNSLTSITLPLDISSATTIDSLVRNAPALTNIDFTGRTNNVFRYCEWMFMGDSSITQLDLRTLDFSNVVSMKYMFQKCASLTSVLVNESWNNINSTVDKSTIFDQCPNISEVTIVTGGEE